MTETTHNEAWNTFWERQKRSGAKSGGGCLPQGWQGIAERQRRVWHSFAKPLPKGARVLDLATGDGAVLAHLLEVRRDLNLTGIDRATALPDAPRGITLRGGVDMAALPFPDNHFAAVTSQFGFEYGDIASIAPEVARVLQPQGRLGLLMHRIDGPIVAHNRKRREQICWALEENDLANIARNSLKLRQSGIAAIPQAIVDAPQRGAKAHGQGSAAWEIAEALRQTLHMGRNDAPARVESVIAEIEMQASNELGRIASLEAAATVASDANALLDTLEAAGLFETGHAMVTDSNSPDPFADYRTFTLKA